MASVWVGLPQVSPLRGSEDVALGLADAFLGRLAREESDLGRLQARRGPTGRAHPRRGQPPRAGSFHLPQSQGTARGVIQAGLGRRRTNTLPAASSVLSTSTTPPLPGWDSDHKWEQVRQGNRRLARARWPTTSGLIRSSLADDQPICANAAASG